MPPLCLADGDNNMMIGKVTTPQKIAWEIRVARILRDCEECDSYFATLTGRSCKPELTKEIIEQCSILEKMPENAILSYSSVYGGTSADKKENMDAVTSYEELCRIFIHLLEALDILRRYRIMHGDIKLDNIVVDNERTYRLIDFGLAITTADSQTTQMSSRQPKHTIYPLWYNAFIDARDNDDDGKPIEEVVASRQKYYYETYGWIAEISNSNYSPGTDTDPIREELYKVATEPRGYMLDVVLPNIFKIDLYSLALAVNGIFNKRKVSFTDKGSKWETKFRMVVLNIVKATFVPSMSYTTEQALEILKAP